MTQAAINGAIENNSKGITIDPEGAAIKPEFYDALEDFQDHRGGSMMEEDQMEANFFPIDPLQQFNRNRAGAQEGSQDPDVLRDSGSEFFYILKNHILKSQPSVNWIKKGLKKALEELDLSHKALLVYVHRPEHQNSQYIASKVLQNPDVAKIIVRDFNSERLFPADWNHVREQGHPNRDAVYDPKIPTRIPDSEKAPTARGHGRGYHIPGRKGRV